MSDSPGASAEPMRAGEDSLTVPTDSMRASTEFDLPAARVQWGEHVEAARREWLSYRAYFDCVDDPELIDHAIYSIQAAERKYMYLLRRARMAGIDLEEPVGPDALEAEK